MDLGTMLVRLTRHASTNLAVYKASFSSQWLYTAINCGMPYTKGHHRRLEAVCLPLLHATQQKMEAGQYSSVAEFEQDMLLIWDNCMIYNRVSVVIYRDGPS